jgi:MFS family permease
MKISPAVRQSLYAALAAFCVYSCMYAFRKPFTAATYEGMTLWGLSYKVWLVIAQTCGYALSKFYGIRFIAEMQQNGRRSLMLGLILTAWLALLGFALAPPPFNILFLFVNGIPLGMVFGVVFSYLEGRRSTEFLGAVLATSFVFSSGFVKSVGKWLMVEQGSSWFWMPFVTGAFFVAPLLVSTWLLDRTPPPTAEDRVARSQRLPMLKADRQRFIHIFREGVFLLVLVYVMLTILRDVRDNFAAEIWAEQGYGAMPSIFTTTEIPVTLAVLTVTGLLVLVSDNLRALRLNHLFVLAGFVIAAISTLFFMGNMIGPAFWFACTGLGLYLGYVPFNCLLFDRLLAAFRYPGNVGFIMYLADSFGYLGSVSVLLVKELANVSWSWTAFFQWALLIVSVTGSIMILLSWQFFKKKYQDSTG